MLVIREVAANAFHNPIMAGLNSLVDAKKTSVSAADLPWSLKYMLFVERSKKEIYRVR